MIELYKVDKDFEYWWLNYIYVYDVFFFSSAGYEPPTAARDLGLIWLILNIWLFLTRILNDMDYNKDIYK